MDEVTPFLTVLLIIPMVLIVIKFWIESNKKDRKIVYSMLIGGIGGLLLFVLSLRIAFYFGSPFTELILLCWILLFGYETVNEQVYSLEQRREADRKTRENFERELDELRQQVLSRSNEED